MSSLTTVMAALVRYRFQTRC